MVTIAELKVNCQNPVTQSTKNRLDQFYMKSAIYLSWLFIKLGLSANNVTVLSGLVCIFGGIMLAMRSPWLTLLGISCFVLFHILDCSDGQVGRYRKQSSLYGHFLDGYMHFVFDAAFFSGIGIGALISYFHISLVLAVFVALLVPIMFRLILYCGWTIICYERMNMIRAGREKSNDNVANIDLDAPTSELSKNTLPKKIRSILGPVLSIFFSSNAPYAFFCLLVIQLIVNRLFGAMHDFRIYLIVYVAIVGPLLIIRALRQRLKTKAFDKNYLRLFVRPEKISLPRDYFFQ